MPGLDFRALLAQERRRRAGAACPEHDKGDDGGGEREARLLQDKARQQPLLPLSSHAVGQDALQGLQYVPDFLSVEEEAAVVSCLRRSPSARWVAAEGRRMLNWGGKPGERAATALPPFVQALVECLVAAGVYPPHQAPNHVLVNSYAQAGGIPPHSDGDLYLPVVATITLLGPALLRFDRALEAGAPGEALTEVLLRPRCLLVVRGEAYSDALHSIACRPADPISALCCNRGPAGAPLGGSVPRERERISLVFVHKLQV